MKIHRLLFLAIALSTLSSCNKPPLVKVILLAGQSNMEGHDATYLEGLTPEQINTYRRDHNNVQIKYDCYYKWREDLGEPNSSNGKFVDVDFGQGRDETLFGPEVGLAHYLGVNDPNQKYYLIKSCEGSSDLNKNWSATGHCYLNFIKDVDNGINLLKTKHSNFQITGFVWMQGEADSFNLETANIYKDNMLDLLNRINTRYKDYLPKRGIILADGGISTTSGKCTYADVINQAKKDVASTDPDYYYVADSETLPMVSDWHYTAEGYLTLGEKFAEVCLK